MVYFLHWLRVTKTKAMTDISATVLGSIQTAQVSLATIYSLLGLTLYQFPPTCTVQNNSYTDYIIVGCGSAGSVLASRLSEDSGVSVTVFEAGAAPPFESQLPGAFPLLPLSAYDYNYTAEDDGKSAQNLRTKNLVMTQGRMIGGSGSLDHMIHVLGHKFDFDEWAEVVGDNSWNYENIRKYMKMQENLIDEEILSSSYAEYHGTGGYKDIQRETNSANENYLKAFQELGHEFKVDISDETSLGCNEPLLNIANGERKTNAVAYLGAAINRTNLCLATSSTVTKIIISAGTAVGVEMVDANGDTYVVYANKEVILSAGAINTPKILLQSGVGDADELEALAIPVVADLPVGKNLTDHLSAPFIIQMETTTEDVAASNPHVFPVPMNTLYVALDSSQDHPDYQAINLVFPHDSTALVQLCSNVFQYSNEICNKMYAASSGRNILFVVLNLMKPESRGNVSLSSSNYSDNPKVHLGLLSDDSDLSLMAKSLEDFNRVLNTTYFKSVNATFVDLDLCADADDIWQCYALAMSNTMWHYSGTCAMGSVLDSDLSVKGISGLRVVDASSMPTIPSGNILAPLTMLAEKAAAIIKAAQ